MGKGDKKTKRGKIFMGSYGVRRPKKVKKTVTPEPAKELNKKTIKKEEVVIENVIPKEEKTKKVKSTPEPKKSVAEEKPKKVNKEEVAIDTQIAKEEKPKKVKKAAEPKEIVAEEKPKAKKTVKKAKK
jgi:30S ribosomal protein S31